MYKPRFYLTFVWFYALIRIYYKLSGKCAVRTVGGLLVGSSPSRSFYPLRAVTTSSRFGVLSPSRPGLRAHGGAARKLAQRPRHGNAAGLRNALFVEEVERAMASAAQAWVGWGEGILRASLCLQARTRHFQRDTRCKGLGTPCCPERVGKRSSVL